MSRQAFWQDLPSSDGLVNLLTDRETSEEVKIQHCCWGYLCFSCLLTSTYQFWFFHQFLSRFVQYLSRLVWFFKTIFCHFFKIIQGWFVIFLILCFFLKVALMYIFEKLSTHYKMLLVVGKYFFVNIIVCYILIFFLEKFYQDINQSNYITHTHFIWISISQQIFH